ncbi:MAG: nitrous oxide reductase accessory protein NosL [Comamonadaceae bacterium]|nr:nitrous oxide reductase accessory protein NosL [Comamonadaceae bacterium]
MLVQYSDDLTDGVCSIHCLAISLALNIDREPKNIWGTDYGSEADPRPLHPVDKLTYLIGADLKHAMTKRSKHSFASKEVLEQFKAKHGGTPGNFDEALQAGLPRHGRGLAHDPQDARGAAPARPAAEAGLSGFVG